MKLLCIGMIKGGVKVMVTLDENRPGRVAIHTEAMPKAIPHLPEPVDMWERAVAANGAMVKH